MLGKSFIKIIIRFKYVFPYSNIKGKCSKLVKYNQYINN